MNKKKSQTAIEFVLLVAVVLFFFAGFFVVVQGSISDKAKQRKNLIVKEIALTIQDEINLASESTDGYLRVFELPAEIGGEDYEVSIAEDMAYVKTGDNKFAVALPVPTITGELSKARI